MEQGELEVSKKILCLIVLLISVAAVQNIAWADNGLEHRKAQEWPIKLGTSGGNINDRSTLFCCSGTLGALVEDGANQYILSNNHVLAKSNHGTIGDGINQPGQIDQGCAQTGIVASLTDFVKIRFKKGRSVPLNTVDAAIAIVATDAVDPNGEILDIAQLSSETAVAQLGQEVQKSGRTTGHTTGIVTSIGVIVDIGYSKECNGAPNQTARFTNQFFVTGEPNKPFSAGGDSGSLVVEDTPISPRAVGLLFAGGTIDGNEITIANPIDAVLNAFGVVMLGAGVPPGPDPNLPNLTGSITGTVTNSSTGNPIGGATVSTDSVEPTTTQTDGSYLLSNVPTGTQEVTASANGFRNQTRTTTVVAGATAANIDFALRVQKGGGGGRGKKSNRGAIQRALKAKNRHANSFLTIDGIVGVGVGLSADGQPVVEFYLAEDSAKVKKQIPSKLDDVPTKTIVTGTFEAF